MQRLKDLIKQYGRWKDLSVYVDRIETHIEIDFSLAIENAKALLEAISREICDRKSIEINGNTNTNSLVKKAFNGIGYTKSTSAVKVSTALGTIGQEFGEIRNAIGATSHGKPLKDIRERNDLIDELSKELLIESTIIIASFLIRSFENFNPSKHPSGKVGKSLEYNDDEEFNEFWDNIHGEYEMGDYSYAASEILYNVDNLAYLTERHQFRVEQDEQDN